MTLGIKIGQIWRCSNDSLVKVIDKRDENNPKMWQFDVLPLDPEDTGGPFCVTGEGKFWETRIEGSDDYDESDLAELVSVDEFPEYYL